MILTHKPVNGRCLFCRARVQEQRIPEWPSEMDDYGETLYHDCPKARGFLLKLYLFLWLPFIFLSAGLNPFLYSLILGVVVFVAVLPPGDAHWIGLQEVRAEYEALIATFPSGRRSAYLKRVDEALKPLFPLRDRALRAHQTLLEQSPADIETRINQIREKSQSCDDNDLTEMYRAQLRDLYDNHKQLDQMKRFIEKFQASKKSVLASLQLLRNKLFIAERGGDSAEEGKIIDDLQLLHDIFKRVNEGSGAGQGKPVSPNLSGPSTDPWLEEKPERASERRREPPTQRET